MADLVAYMKEYSEEAVRDRPQGLFGVALAEGCDDIMGTIVGAVLLGSEALK
jgi:hypothetical protein